MNEVLIVDPSYIGGMLNAKMITFSISKTRALNFISVVEAHEFTKKYEISPSLILLDEKLTADAVQVRQWLEECENKCPIHIVSASGVEKEKDGLVVVANEVLVDHVGSWLAN